MPRTAIDFCLTNSQLEDLNSVFPESNGSAVIGLRAERIVEIYLRTEDPGCQVTRPKAGADLHVIRSDGVAEAIEVKGTRSSQIAWPQLKVSSRSSFTSLTEEKTPIYRVCDVFSTKPKIFVLRHGLDFDLVEEPRWALRPIPVSSAPRDRTAAPKSRSQHEGGLPRASKYDALRDYLDRNDKREVVLKFNDAPNVLGFELPVSAYNHQAYWANQQNTTNRPWARAWTEAGYEVDGYKLDRHIGWVRFRKRNAEP